MGKPHLDARHARALARRDFSFFARCGMISLHPATDILWNWHLDLICSHLTDVLEGRTRRLIINIPPRYGKSLLASVLFPAFILGNNPEAEIICVSYAQGLSEKLADQVRRLMLGQFYTDVFATRLVSPRARLAELKTTKGGSRLATSVEGTLTGRGGNFLILDDVLKPSEALSEVQRKSVNQWYDDTVPSRINDKQGGAIIVIMQRLHQDDLVGHLLEKGGWTVLSLPAIAEEDETHIFRNARGLQTVHRKSGEALHPARESVENIADVERTMGPYPYAAQYQQRPAPAGGGLVRWDWFPRYDPADMPVFTRKVQSWDTASKDKEQSDYSVCVTIGETQDRRFYVLDIFRGRLQFPELKQKLVQLANLHQASNVLIEDSSSGTQLIQMLQREGFARVLPIRAAGSKYERLSAATGLIQAQKVWLPDQAHWLGPLQTELSLFPNGTHDDQADALSQGLLWISEENRMAKYLRYLEDFVKRQEEDM